ncbi:hypothetical protein [Nesterenkonia sp. NBAIMH1]|uniref:hypothetical protein n=1 Tax=Nesterenkonia sp. NBAIMH1 TaxID=2600320 RepID=UPI0011B7CF7E|nr:hypothetical protein [Nesterenkonia sp. NBAIMH1]
MTFHTDSSAYPDSDSAESTARRMKPPSWKDPRLIVGTLLVAASVGGVVALVAEQNRTAPAYAAARALAVGEEITEDDLVTVDVQLGEGSGKYLLPGERTLEGMVISRVEEGEFIPLSSLAASDPEGRQPVTVEIEHELPRALSAGRAAEVWGSAAGGYGEDGEVSRLVASAELADVRARESAFGTQSATTVELLVDADDVPGILQAVSDGHQISLLPAQPAVESDADNTGESR